MTRKILSAYVLIWLTCGAVHAEESVVEPRIWAYRYVFATADSAREFDPLLQHIHAEPELQDLTLDYVAEALVSPLNLALDSEAQKLLVRSIAQNSLKKRGGGRYRRVFEEFLTRTTDPKLREAAHRYLRRQRNSPDDQYVPGSLDFAALRAQYAAAALTVQPTDSAARELATLPEDSSIDDLFALAGTPQAVVSGQIKAGDGLINIKVQRLAFYYRGLGRVVFGFRKFEDWKSQGIVIDPMAFEELMPYREHPGEFGQPDDENLWLRKLLSGSTNAMKTVLVKRYRTTVMSPEFLDTTAEVLVKEHGTARDPFAVDAFSWMCRLLTQFGGARYSNILSSVEATTQDEKLRKFAQLPVNEKASAAGAAPYVEGTISLAAQRAKYPSLYPERSLTSGEL